MPQEITLTKKVNTYIESLFVPQEKDFDVVMKESKKQNLPPIQINPVIGKILYLLVKMNQSKNILEIGTLGGYSTLWLAKALPKDGKVITLELQKSHADVAIENFKNIGFDKMIEVQIGAALELLPKIKEQFDFFFIDAHKEEYKEYVEHAIRLSHPGSVIVCDNVIRNGWVIEKESEKEYYKSLQRFNAWLAENPKLESSILPTMLPLTGRDYLDGVSISIVK